MKPSAIIGGGLGGLSAACVLAARGHTVVLFERNDWLGGKAAQLNGDGSPFRYGADYYHDAVRSETRFRGSWVKMKIT